MMDFNSLDKIKEAGFTGFLTIKELFLASSLIPKIKGVYMVINTNFVFPDFVEVGTGGHFKDKNPNVSLEELKSNWVPNSIVLYIGKAGGEGSSATLQTRLKQYLSFGQGRKVGHWGGRLIWQLKDAEKLQICWKAMPIGEPREFENQLIKQYTSKFRKRPFANLTN